MSYKIDANINEEAFILIKKLHNPNFKITLTAKACFEKYLEYLENIYFKHNRKTPKENNVFDMLFFTRGIPEKSIANFCKTHLHVGIQTLKNYKTFLERIDRYNFYGLKDLSFLIREIVFDLKPYILFFERQTNPTFEYLRFEKSNSGFSFQLNNAARKLIFFTYNKNIHLDGFTLLEMSPHMIRASIEKKIKRVLGIGNIYFQDDFSSPLIRNQFYFEFLKKSQNYIYPQGFELKKIERIYKWCNFPIHSGYRPKVHELDFALSYSSKLFNSNHKSLHNSIHIKEYEKIQKLLRDAILRELKNKPFRLDWVAPEAEILS